MSLLCPSLPHRLSPREVGLTRLEAPARGALCPFRILVSHLQRLSVLPPPSRMWGRTEITVEGAL